MLSRLENDSIYLINLDKSNRFHQLLNEQKHLSAYLADFSRGYSFQSQVALDLFTFLTTKKEGLFIDQFRSLERPLNAYIHEILSKQYEFEKFKRMHSQNDLLALTVSIFVTKQIISDLYEQVISTNEHFINENPLELIITIDNNSLAQPPLTLKIQSLILKKMKEVGMNLDYCEKIARAAIVKAKALEQFFMKEV